VVGMVLLGTSGHDFPSFIYNPTGIIGHTFSAACSIALCTNRSGCPKARSRCVLPLVAV
jgi:hypothetical protein